MRVLVVGTGGVGTAIAALLHRSGRAEVALHVPGEDGEQLARDGVFVMDSAEPASLTIDVPTVPTLAGTWDVVLLNARYGTLATALLPLGPVVGPDTVVVAIGAHLDGTAVLGETFGTGRTALAFPGFLACRDGWTLTLHRYGRGVIGGTWKHPMAKVRQFAEILTASGLATNPPRRAPRRVAAGAAGHAVLLAAVRRINVEQESSERPTPEAVLPIVQPVSHEVMEILQVGNLASSRDWGPGRSHSSKTGKRWMPAYLTAIIGHRQGAMLAQRLASAHAWEVTAILDRLLEVARYHRVECPALCRLRAGCPES